MIPIRNSPHSDRLPKAENARQSNGRGTAHAHNYLVRSVQDSCSHSWDGMDQAKQGPASRQLRSRLILLRESCLPWLSHALTCTRLSYIQQAAKHFFYLSRRAVGGLLCLDVVSRP